MEPQKIETKNTQFQPPQSPSSNIRKKISLYESITVGPESEISQHIRKQRPKQEWDDEF
ncbi:hypothetical protein [Flavobacterium sp. 3-210]